MTGPVPCESLDHLNWAVLDLSVHADGLHSVRIDRRRSPTRIEGVARTPVVFGVTLNINRDNGSLDDQILVVGMRKAVWPLEEDVLAQRAPHETTGRLEMRTEAMQVRPNDRRAQSSAPATLLERQADGEPRWTSDSERLSLDWGGERLTQTGTVRDVYRTGDAP